jgi:hypothetical protein
LFPLPFYLFSNFGADRLSSVTGRSASWATASSLMLDQLTMQISRQRGSASDRSELPLRSGG